MTKAAREAYNAYMREWRKKNPDKASAHRERYWEKRAAEMQMAIQASNSDHTSNDKTNNVN